MNGPLARWTGGLATNGHAVLDIAITARHDVGRRNWSRGLEQIQNPDSLRSVQSGESGHTGGTQ